MIDSWRGLRRGLGRGVLLGAALLVLAAAPLANADWGAEVKLSTDEVAAGLNENMGQCLIAHGDVVHVVWADLKNNGQAIYYKRSTDKGKTWGKDTRISPSPGTDTNPLIALAGSNLHLVFLRDAGTPEAASYYKRSKDGGLTWEPEVLLGKTKWWPGVAAAGDNVYVSLNTVFADDAKNSAVYFRRSTDCGATWEPEQPLSQAARRTGQRSEDPAISADGKYVHLVWNDNRDSAPGKGMAVYYRRSSDAGKTWDPEKALTHAPEYTYFPAIHLTGASADVVYGDRQSGHYDIFHQHSTDCGTTWGAKEEITKTPTEEFYPSLVRDGSNVHMVWTGKEGVMYLYSNNGGASWDPVISLTSKGAQPFIAVAGEAVHVVFVSRRDGHGAIYYKCNPTGNKAKP